MYKLLLLGTLVGIGFGVTKFIKKTKKENNDISQENTVPVQ